jgi:hypothetical protein
MQLPSVSDGNAAASIGLFFAASSTSEKTCYHHVGLFPERPQIKVSLLLTYRSLL